ncbi:MAG: PQQ-binding-like beta-propeller repeat protein [bacterium]
MNRTALGIASILAAWAAVGSAVASPDSILVRCRVYHDLDGDGSFQPGEPSLPGVRVTNGVDVLVTDAAGRADVWVDRERYRFATLTIPAGFWPSGAWYRWVPVGTSGPDSADFGLKTWAPTASDPVRWVHITDTQVWELGPDDRLDVVLEEINELSDSPAFLVNTGDLVELGSDTAQWDNYVGQLPVSDAPVLNVVGCHDIIGVTPPHARYEQYVGPPYYSFEAGSWHLVVYNSEAPAGTPSQDTWLAEDLAAAPSGSHVVLFQHDMLKQVVSSKVAAWSAAGVRATFTGHWHALQFTRRPEGVVDYNLSWTRGGPRDHTPRVFAIVTMEADGSIGHELRRLGVDHRTAITHPQPGQPLADDPLEILVQSYDTSSRVATLSASVTGPGGTVASPLAAEGHSLWRATVDVSALAPGPYDLTVTGAFEDGTPIAETSEFQRIVAAPIPRVPATDWPMFRKCPAGSSFTATPLEPPLSLAWSTPVPGLVGLSSPVVADGRVYLGCRAERALDEAGVLACDARTGEIEWFTHIPGGVALAPAVAGNVVIVTAMPDSIFGLDSATGQRFWSLANPESHYHLTAPIVAGPVAWVGGEPSPLQIRWATGTVEWVAEDIGRDDWNPSIYSAPALDAGSSYVYFGNRTRGGSDWGGFAIVRRLDGALVSFVQGTFRSPIWTGQTLYTIGGANWWSLRLAARDELGAPIWTSPEDFGSSTGSPALAHGVLVAPARDGAIKGVRASDGATLWTHAVGVELYDMVNIFRSVPGTEGAAAIADSVVWIGSLDGWLYALDLASGTELWKWFLGTPIGSSPAISGNMLFVGASDGHLYGFVSGSPVPSNVELPSGPLGAISFPPPRPNPSGDELRFEWSLPAPVRVRLSLFDAAGRRVLTLVDEHMAVGPHFFVWDGAGRSGERLASGIYFARLEAGDRTIVRKVVRLHR